MKRTPFVLIVLLSCITGCQHKLNNPQTPQMNALATLENTRWKLVSVPGQDSLPTLEKEVYIQFNKSDSSFRGYAGCNNMTGKFTMDGNKLTIGPAAMTRMMCPPANMKVEDLLTKTIHNTDRYNIKGQQLELKKGDELLALFEAVYLK